MNKTVDESGVYLERAGMMLRQNNYLGAIENYNKAFALKAQQPAWVYLGLGDALAKNNQLVQAIAAYKKSINLNAKNGIAYAKLGSVMGRMSHEESAIKHYKKAFSFHQDYPIWVYISYANSLYNQAEFSQSINICRAGISRYPEHKNASLYWRIAQAQTRLGKFNQAIENYQKVLKLQPQESLQIYQQLGDLFIEQKRYRKALKNYAKSLRININGFSHYSCLDEAICQIYANNSTAIEQGLKDILPQANKTAQKLTKYLKLGFLGKEGATIDPLSYYFINDNLKIIYCSIPKNACTLFKNLIVEYSSSQKKYQKSQQNIHQFLAQNRPEPTKLINSLESANYFKFVVLRNPFARLVSAYLDKFAKHPIPESFAQQVIIAVQTHLAKPINIQESITFQQFIEYLARTSDRYLNDHWLPQSNFLGSINFDYIGQFEQLDLTIKLLEKKFSIAINQKVSSHITEYKNFDKQLEFYRMYPQQLRSLEGMPAAWQMYNGQLKQLVAKRYSQDISLYLQQFKMDFNNLLPQT